MKYDKYEEMEIWKISQEIVKLIYDLTKRDNFKKDFNLKNQITRAAVSISSNIAEGFERNNNKEFIHFLKFSKGSLGEVKSQLNICKDINYISENEY